ncbi:MAG: hypothetical protein CM15mP68_2390 [Pseudomonadota bacterium]|nr:MAG: hypothetical protein CM15mP68_2390 [Pseudomonadota bacterium]
MTPTWLNFLPAPKNHLRLGQPWNPVESSRRGATAAQQTYRIGRDQGTATAAPALLSSGSAACPIYAKTLLEQKSL